MHYVIYIDILFLVNFFMDFIILTLNGTVLKKKTKTLRRLIASFCGGVCYCLPFFLPRRPIKLALNLYMLCISFLMVKIAYQIKSKKEFAKTVVFFYGTSFFVGGTINGLYNYTKLGDYIRQIIKGDKDAQIEFSMLIVLICAACFLWTFLMKCYSKRQTEAIIYSVILKNKKRTVKGKALLDTGNCLREPISQKPVMLLELSWAEDLLEREIWEAIVKFYKTGEISIPIYLIPYSSVGKKQGVLVGIRADSLEILQKDNRIEIRHPYVAICPEALSKTGKYHMLLHTEWFHG
ncbi:MAG: sigma-E processing peptidase SpoIIGA [Lachnospiraceae bacterium]|nr:sigma-E processing peptidase SpoIIGA [Lachnospiraceae bacterium]